jgi:hypothetical protein
MNYFGLWIILAKRINLTGSECFISSLLKGCLAVTRAFGDRSLQPYVIADPDIKYRPVDIEQVRIW